MPVWSKCLSQPLEPADLIWSCLTGHADLDDVRRAHIGARISGYVLAELFAIAVAFRVQRRNSRRAAGRDQDVTDESAAHGIALPQQHEMVRSEERRVGKAGRGSCWRTN